MDFYADFGSFVLSCRVGKKETFEMHCTTPVAFVLMQFNGKNVQKHASSALQKSTSLSKEQVKQVIEMLSGKEINLLKQSVGSTRKSANDLTFEINDEFTPAQKVYTVGIKKAEMVIDKATQNKVNQSVTADRKYHVDSILIKTMKKEQKLLQSELLKQTFDLLLFPMTEDQIMTRIDELCKRMFFEREGSGAEATIKYRP